ncbi:MAG: aminopeptidase P family protein [Thermoplasmatales archaeon]|nr:aminopeptidase P family protein [Thermoplasmatales archaeon]
MRWKKIFELANIDALFIKNFRDENFFYFTKAEGIHENSIAIVTRDDVKIISAPLEKEGIFYHSKEELKKILKEFLDGKKVGFNGASIPYNDLIKLKKMVKAEFIDVSEQIKEVRVIKDEEEIRKIKKSCLLTLKAIEEIDFHNKKEKDVAFEIDYKINRNAKIAFPTIVAFGKNSSIPHHIPSKKLFSNPAIIDCGAKYKGYCSDITRTFYGERERKVYEIVNEALDIAIDDLREGVNARDLYKKVEKFFSKYKFKMIHGLGHSIGLEVHDGYSIGKDSNFLFKENMVFAIEPAIYTKNFGIRIEEDVLIKKNRANILSK